MNASRFDRLVRALTDGATPRRVVLRGLAGAGFAAALLPWIGEDLDARRGKKRGKRKKGKQNKKPPVNRFGCRNVGVACSSAGQCCSGICEGGRRRKGKKTRKTCRAHDTGGCRVEQDSCSGEFFPCTATNGADGFCHVTTGNAPYCGVSSTTFDCTKDEDCIDLCGPEAACVVCDNPDLGSFQVCIGLKEECLSP
ncbi:MAG: hypothetical protein K0S78_130 [Thermomicrobiales bacterium]|jgi:hypothetical protein|nr:hypothetical protein [Thermomicrobiales bacterium]